ncbi:hypothetical protein V6N13_091679 [Hibiscus sabdariffa]|uniref:Uncharacterized protein n=1 Tax=Hibiscus sabdariffa TaxID=183260 RepID=A0ABR2QEL9_9ROSI
MATGRRHLEVELYNSMVEKEGTEDEEEAKKAYQAAREHSDHTAQKAIGDKVSSALIDRVMISVDLRLKQTSTSILLL